MYRSHPENVEVVFLVILSVFAISIVSSSAFKGNAEGDRFGL